MKYLQYVQPTGNRQTYSNTNLVINDMEFRFEFEYLYLEEQTTGGDWSECLGTGYPSKFRFGSLPTIFVMYGGSNYNAPDNTVLDGEVIIDKTGLWCNETKLINISSPSSSIPSNPLTIGGDYDYPSDALVKSNTKLGRLKVYHSDVLVADFRPANNNGTIGFYDEVGQVFYDSDGSQPWIAGPAISSISVTASKSSLAATGETISIEVSCENAWTVTGNTFLTLSSTGDTGSTTITATAPSYTGATDRTDTLTFTDSVTGDEVEISIKQKKYSAGQPVYLGANEVGEIYLGENAISEAYLGDVQVFSSGPFQGLKMSPKDLKFMNVRTSTGDTVSLFIKSSENWTLSTDADWFTLSPSTGLGNSQKTEVTLTVTSIPTAETTNTISCTTANYSASTSVLFKMGYGIPANEIWYATYNSQPITSISRWKVYDKNNVQMQENTVDYSTYGKWVFPRDIGYVAGDPYYVNSGNLNNLTELGLPEMDSSMCISSNDFGWRYINVEMPYWTRVYGDYPYIDEDEKMAWGSDGGGTIISRGNTGTLNIPEGIKYIGAYGLTKSKYTDIILPISLTGITGFENDYALGYACLEYCRNLQSIKYQTSAAPKVYNNLWNGVTNNGTAYLPTGATGYSNNHKPNNFTFVEY